MTPPDFVTPVVLAAVFTLGGYVILRMRDGADRLGVALLLVLLACGIMTMGALVARQAWRVPPDAAEVVRARAP